MSWYFTYVLGENEERLCGARLFHRTCSPGTICPGINCWETILECNAMIPLKFRNLFGLDGWTCLVLCMVTYFI